MDTCKVDVCERPVFARGYCDPHYSWARRRNFEEEPKYKVGKTHFKPPTFDVDNLTDKELGWVAGILDGESWMQARKWDGGTSCQINVKMSHRPAIEKLNSLLPSATKLRHRERQHDRHNDTWTWTLNRRKNVIPLLKRILPLLTVKREKAKELIDFHYEQTNT